MFLSRQIPFNVPGQVHGSMIYFDGTAWLSLTPGSSGPPYRFLRTNGVGAAPSWETLPPFSLPGEATGDLVYFDGTAWVRRALGAVGEVLTVGTGNEPKWLAPTPFSVPGATLGDLLYYDGTAWTRLPSGPTGKLLHTAGTGAPPFWAAYALSILGETRGDVLYYNGTAWTRLAAGTSGHVLTTQGPSGNPVWQAAPGAEKVRAAGSFLGTGTYTVTLTVPNGLPTAGTVRIYEVNAAIRQGSKWETTYLRFTVTDAPAIEGTPLLVQDDTGISPLPFVTSPPAIVAAAGPDLQITIAFVLGIGGAEYRVSAQEA